MTSIESFDFSRSDRPPWLPSTVSWCAVAASVALAVYGPDGHGIVVPLVGWLAGGVVPIAGAITHRLWDRQRRRRPNYTRGRLARPAATLAPAIGFIAGLPHVWVLAWFLTQWLNIADGAT